MKIRYIYIILLLSAGALFIRNASEKELPMAIGEPLEIIVIKNSAEHKDNFYETLRKFLSVEIGPSPQPEKVLSIIELDQASFKGIFKRHQNLLFVTKSDTFNITHTKNIFAKNQSIFSINSPSYNALLSNKQEIVELVHKIKDVEIKRQILKYKNQKNLSLQGLVKDKHNLSILLPKNFFLALDLQETTWIRNETSKIGQGILVTNLDQNSNPLSAAKIYSIVDSIIQTNIFGPLENSYMALENRADKSIDTVMLGGVPSIKIQSLWRMENDFMGGVFQLYYIPGNNNISDRIIYTYVYAPGENKKIPLIHLESIVKTTDFL